MNLKKIFKYYFSLVFKIFPYRYIVFESNPDFSDNTYRVFQEMKNRNLNKKYKFVWLCHDLDTLNKLESKDVRVFHVNHKWSKKYYLLRAKYIISCNSYIEKISPSQVSIYLGHGIAIKSMKTYQAPPNIDWFIGTSEKGNEIMKSAFKCNMNKFIITGYPRNDILFVNNREKLNTIFNQIYDKIIIWYPTYRQHKNSNVISASENSVPIIHNAKSAYSINDIAKKHNVLIILKPHFSQDITSITKHNLSNIKIINDKFFIKHNISSYELIASCDALITDYSSIYFDYLLCNKPIAAIWEDIEEYRKNRGFCIDIDFYMKGAYKIFNTADFVKFIETVSKNLDTLDAERKEVKNLIFQHQDDKSTKRVVDFIESIG